MSPVWSVVLVLLAFTVIMRMKHRTRGRRNEKSPSFTTRIDGFQVNAFLSPQIGAGCLFDSGMQFGKGFRRKVGPALPHDEHCQCTTVPFSHTSNEVFHGALRSIGVVRSTIEGLSQETASKLFDMLKEANDKPLPENADAYIASFDRHDLGLEFKSQIEAFLRERFTFLSVSSQAEKERETTLEPSPPKGTESG